MRRLTILLWVFVVAGAVTLAAEWAVMARAGTPARPRPGAAGGIVVLGSLVAAVAFVWAVLRARTLAERAGVEGYRWSKAWTVVTLFIPVLNLIRPWLGFSEIARSLRGAAARGELGDAWRRDRRADTATFLLWLLVLLSLVLGVVLGGVAVGGGLRGTPEHGTATLLAFGHWMGFWLDVAIAAGAALYLAGIRRDLRRVLALASHPPL